MEINEALQRLKDRLEADQAFEAELKADPENVVLRETGLTFDQLVQGVSELHEDDLANVTGGVGGGPDGNLSLNMMGNLDNKVELLHWTLSRM